MTHEYVDRTERIGGLIVQVVADTSGDSSPRENDNFTQIYGDHRNYVIGDGQPPSEHAYYLARGGIALLYRYMRRYGDPAADYTPVLAFSKLGMIDHSGVSFYTVPIGSSSDHWADPGGWDSGAVGYVYITRARWDEIGGGDPAEIVDGSVDMPLGSIAVKRTRVSHILEAEVSEYDDWARGNVWGYVISRPCDHADEHDTDEEIAECPHSDNVGSCWGFVGDPEYALAEAKAEAEALAAVPA